jgi:hypothetical protein
MNVKLDFNQIVRYFLAGVIAPVTLIISFPDSINAINRIIRVPFNSAMILLVILSIGMIMYSVHRGVIYFFIFQKYVKNIYGDELKNGKKLDDVIDDIHYKRCLARSELDLYEKSGLYEWFARIHFSYSAGWLIFITIFIGLFIPGNTNWIAVILFAALGAYLIISAIINDIQAIKMEKEIVKNKEDIIARKCKNQ